ncbi:MAG: ATPase, T2SS/T4P/T4SS family [Actinomycetota bacterium]
MTDIDRLIERIVDTSDELERGHLERAGEQVVGEVAPLAGPGAVERAVDAIVGLGPIEHLAHEPRVTDILVNGHDEVWIERAGHLERTDIRFRSDEDVIAMVRRLVAPLGLRIDRASPAVDARLGDGSRLHALIPPASVDGPVVAIRRFVNAVADLDALEESGAVSRSGSDVLATAVRERENVLIAGATGAGKTTLLNVLASNISPGDRVVTIEDAAELSLPGHVVRLEAHPPNVEGAGEITIRTLVRHALRLRPDRLVVGEVRGAEALDMVQALNTGHAGSMSTIHANDADAAIDRLVAMCAMAPERVPPETLYGQVRSAIGMVVVMARTDDGRVVRSIHRRNGASIEPVYRC